ncbi:HRDC domain-containing protein [Paenibacillus allorhizosphaerae]|nr:HRDC domain-containing protein [Paenibacillus allorhizosphaerae]
MFLNSLEKETGEGRVRTAQVSIGENQGSLHVLWTETKEDGHRTQENWYDGSHWDELLAAFRERLFMKQCDGFKPVVDVSGSDLAGSDGRSIYIQMLQYYSEANSDEKLYEALRGWRLKQAGREGKAPFIVATNRQLRMISAFVPQTVEELQQLPGFGRGKTAAYGADILALTVQCERNTSFPLTWVEGEINREDFHGWLLQEKERKRKAEVEKQEMKRTLLEAIHRGERLDALQEQIKVQRRDLLLWIEELDREGYDLEAYIEQVLEQVPQTEREHAWQAFEQQGDRYLKPILQTVYRDNEFSAKEVDRIYEWLRLLRLKFRRVNGLKTGEAS